MNQYKTNIFTSVFFILFGVLVWWAVPYCIRYADTYSMGNELLTSYFMPRVLVVILVFCSSVNLLINLTHYFRAKRMGLRMPVYPGFRREKEGRILAFTLIMLVYAVILEPAGFLISSAVCSTALLVYVRDRKLPHYIITYVFILAAYLIFTRVLYVKLP